MQVQRLRGKHVGLSPRKEQFVKTTKYVFI